jgi:hypothetical protein
MDEPQDYYNSTVLSTCCGAPALGEIEEFEGVIVGVCSRCKEHSDFEPDE